MSQNHLIIGLGGAGGRSLAAIKRAMILRKSDVESIKEKGANFNYLYIDSNDDILNATSEWSVAGESCRLEMEDIIQLKGGAGSQSIDTLSKRPEITEWLGNIQANFAKKKSISIDKVETELRGLDGAGQLRRYGRLLFALNAPIIKNKLLDKVKGMAAQKGKNFCVHIFATLGGGTGSGSIVDMVTLINDVYDDLFGGSSDLDIKLSVNLYLYIAGKAIGTANTGFFFQNEYAALRDLNGLMTGRYHPYVITRFGNRHDSKFRKSNPISSVYLSSEMSPLNVSKFSDQVNYLANACMDAIIFRFLYKDPNGLKAISGEDLVQTTPGETDGNSRELRSYRFAAFGTRRWCIPTQQIQELLRYDIEQIIIDKWLMGTEVKDEGNKFLYTLDSASANDYQTGNTWQEISTTIQKYIDRLEQMRQRILDEDRDAEVLLRITQECNNICNEIEARSFDSNKSVFNDAETYAYNIATRLDQKIAWNAGGKVWGLKHAQVALDNLIADFQNSIDQLDQQNNVTQTQDLTQKMGKREKQWEKLGLLTIILTHKDEEMINDHIRDAKKLISQKFDQKIRQVKRNIFTTYSNELLNLRTRSIDKLINNLKNRQNQAKNEYNKRNDELISYNKNQGNSVGAKYAYDQQHLNNIREVIENDSNTYTEEMATTYQEIWLKNISSLNDVDDNKINNLFASIEYVIYITLDKLHQNAQTKHKLAPILVSSILERLYQIAGNQAGQQNRNWEQNLEGEIIDFLSENKLGCSTSIQGGTGLLKPQVSPVTGLAIGFPEKGSSNVPAEFLNWLKDKIKKSIPSGLSTVESSTQFYDHSSPEEIRILYTPYWMPARFAPVVDKIYEEYVKAVQGEEGNIVAYFANIDQGGEELQSSDRPPLTKNGDPDQKTKLHTDIARMLFYVTKNGSRFPVVRKRNRSISFLQKENAGMPEYTPDYPDSMILFPTPSYKEALFHAIDMTVSSLSNEQKLEIYKPVETECQSLADQWTKEEQAGQDQEKIDKSFQQYQEKKELLDQLKNILELRNI